MTEAVLERVTSPLQVLPEDNISDTVFEVTPKGLEAFGIDRDDAARIGRLATDVGLLRGRLPLHFYAAMNHVESDSALLHKVREGEALELAEIMPYLPDAVRAVRNIRPLRAVVDRKIEAQFPERAKRAMNQARRKIERLEADAEVLTRFDNPRSEFETEISVLAQTTQQAIFQYRTDRLEGKVEALPAPEPGKLGFFTKVVRKISSFFGFFSKQPEARPEQTSAVTAYDAARGIDATINSLLHDPIETSQRLPLLSHFVLDKMKYKKLPGLDALALAAPEILTSLFSALPRTSERDGLLDSVVRNPHELRFVTRYAKQYKGYYLSTIQRLTRSMLPDIRDALPTDSQKIKSVIPHIKALVQNDLALKHNPDLDHAERKPKNHRLRNRMSRMGRKLRRHE